MVLKGDSLGQREEQSVESPRSSTTTVTITSITPEPPQLSVPPAVALKVAEDTSVPQISSKKSGYFEFDRFIHLEIRPGMNEHLQLISELRELVLKDEPGVVSDSFITSNELLWRYLVARRLDIQGARKQAVTAYRWRVMRKPDEIRANHIQVEIATGKCAVRGKDRHERPVIVMDSSRENTYDPDGNMLLLVHSLNRAIRTMRSPVDKYVIVIRLGDTSMFNFSKLPGPTQVRETIKILMTVYAERLGHIVVYQAPRIFTVFLNLFRSIMDAHVISKAVWVSGDVSPGSSNDHSLSELLGSHWRELIGEGQPVIKPKCVPGYDPEKEFAKLVKEEEEYYRNNH